MNLFRSMRFYLVFSLMVSVPMGSIVAAQTRSSSQVTESGLDRAITFLKNVYTLEYLNGPQGKYRNASMVQKIIRQPGRALTTAAVYGLSFYSAKLLYDAAHKYGVFNTIKQDAQLKAYRDRQRVQYEREQRDRELARPAVDPGVSPRVVRK